MELHRKDLDREKEELTREDVHNVLIDQVEAYTIMAVHGIDVATRAHALRRRDLACMMLHSLLSVEYE